MTSKAPSVAADTPAAAVSTDRLLVETDCPDQQPFHRKGSRNLPEWLTDVVSAVAVARGERADDVAALTACNTSRLFGLEDWL